MVTRVKVVWGRLVVSLSYHIVSDRVVSCLVLSCRVSDERKFVRGGRDGRKVKEKAKEGRGWRCVVLCCVGYSTGAYAAACDAVSGWLYETSSDAEFEF